FTGVILDLTIKGGMGGDKAIAGLQQIDPQVKAVIASGYADDPIIKDFKEYGFLGALAKPFSMHNLQELLATL
ncbi:MAG: response regulator, partial [Deltaproteobacteria bacterium]